MIQNRTKRIWKKQKIRMISILCNNDRHPVPKTYTHTHTHTCVCVCVKSPVFNAELTKVWSCITMSPYLLRCEVVSPCPHTPDVQARRFRRVSGSTGLHVPTAPSEFIHRAQRLSHNWKHLWTPVSWYFPMPPAVQYENMICNLKLRDILEFSSHWGS